MYCADYRKGSKKAEVHVGFDLNRSIPKKIFLTDVNEAGRPYFDRILALGKTGISYQRTISSLTSGRQTGSILSADQRLHAKEHPPTE